MPAVAEPAGAADVLNYLREAGSAIARAGATLRRADPSDPAAYRMVRTGIWLGMASPPPAQGSKTSIPAPQASLRTQLEKMAANQKWPEILEECESALTGNRFWLDLHRYSFQALSGMGPAHKRAKEAIVIEVASFLRRMGNVADLTYADGSPFADGATKLWLESDVTVSAGDGGGNKGSGGPPDPNAEADAAALAEAKALIGGGKASDAIAVLQVRVDAASSIRGRFRARLVLAKVCMQGSQFALARALYEGLDKDVVARGLDEWEPALAAEVLEGIVICNRAVAKGGKPLPPDTALLYDRLCRVDPSAAARIG
jgi:type VI secretion system protein VasJ